MLNKELLIASKAEDVQFTFTFEYSDKDYLDRREIREGYVGRNNHPKPFWNTPTGRAYFSEIAHGQDLEKLGEGDDYGEVIFISPTAWLRYESNNFSPIQIELTDVNSGTKILCNFTQPSSPTWGGASKTEVNAEFKYLSTFGDHTFISNPPPDGYI